MFLVSGMVYLLGLVLLVMPPRSVPLMDGTRTPIRLGKHFAGLLLFGLGTLGIHNRLPGEVRMEFVVFSALLVLVLGLIRVWHESSKDDVESSPGAEESGQPGEHEKL